MNSLPRTNPKYLGLDPGEHKIGLAVGDPVSGFVFTRPTLVVDTWREAWPVIVAMIQQEGITEIVVGLPLNTDGSAGPQAERSREFMRQLGQHVQVPIEPHDERLTTQAVLRQSGGQPVTDEDSQAARLILESYMVSR